MNCMWLIKFDSMRALILGHCAVRPQNAGDGLTVGGQLDSCERQPDAMTCMRIESTVAIIDTCMIAKKRIFNEKEFGRGKDGI